MESAIRGTRLGQSEINFIRHQDSFYQATIGQNGWPYVQFRGGPPGFLKVLDASTLTYADFQGNKQYISVGNISGIDKVALILLDYATQTRLKIWARAKIVALNENEDMLSQLVEKSYDARCERMVQLKVEAFDWNCPRHIPLKLSQQQIIELIEPYQQRIQALETQVNELKVGKP